VFGIAARNGILLINHFQYLEREEGEPFGIGLARRGARERLSPILITAFATGLALAPALFLGDLPGLEIVRPMAVVVLGGVITATSINLLIVPALYLRLAVSSARELEPARVNGVAHPALLGGLAEVPGLAAGT
jgi:Cu/Ag efflux pump CusA